VSAASAFEPESTRLERLWEGDFGDDYVDRNADVDRYRQPFWSALLASHRPARVLEVGCNLGGNLRWIAEAIGDEHTYGVDVNRKALAELRARLPGVNGVWSPARDLPFRDRWFDLVFTMGVLIHQPEATLPLVMAEMVRCSRRYVLCGEYFAEQTVEVKYRGHEGALFKRNYGGLFGEMFPELRVVESQFLGREQGWDDVTVWLFEKSG
jgi:pseudaminic acid biosynthesis-associated methylase